MQQHRLVEARQLSAAYDDELIVSDISFQLVPKELVAIIGPNGGGKTTLIKLVLGLLKPVSGSILYGDEGRKSPSFEIGYLPQQNTIDPRFPISVAEVVSSGLLSHKQKSLSKIPRRKERVQEVLERVHMEKYAKQAIGELSGGQLQRVLLARAIVSDPELLILDEPNTYVDNRFEGHLYKLLAELQQEMCILMVTHDLGQLESLAQKIYCVNQRLHIHEDVQAFLSNPAEHGAFIRG